MAYLVGTQVLVETPTDVVTTATIIETGLNVDAYYSDVEEDGVVTPHDNWAKLNEVCCVVFSVFVACALFRVAPLPIFCREASLCSCAFQMSAIVCGNTTVV